MKNCFPVFIKLLFLSISFKAYCFNYVSESPLNIFFARSNGYWHLSDTTIQPGSTSGIIAPGATPQLVSNQFSFTEGPAANKKGEVFFSDQPNDKIWKYGTDGKLSIFLDRTGRSNGMYFDKKGNLISCADEKNELWCISPKRKVTVLLSSFESKKLNGPNDLWIHPKGGIYFTDPYYQRSYWERKAPEIKGQKLYYLPKGKKEAIVADENLVQPNGIIGTRDGRYLYVADVRDRKTYRYTINADGSLKDRQLFAAQGSDGMSIDDRGNIYFTGNGVTVYTAEGKKIEQIAIRGKATTNVCFGGKNNNILFITATDCVYTLQMQVKGAE